jgi:hypothetical protein
VSVSTGTSRFNTAEPAGWGRRQFLADLRLEETTDGGQILASDELVDPDYDTPISYLVQLNPREEGSNQPTHTLGLSQQTLEGEWEAPIKIVALFPPQKESIEKAKAGGYHIPALSGQPPGWKEMDPDDPECCRYEIWLGTDPVKKPIPEKQGRLYFRRLRTALEPPRVNSIEEFVRLGS